MISPGGGGGGTTARILGSGEAFGLEALSAAGGAGAGAGGANARAETAVAEPGTTLLVMSREVLDRTIGSLNDARLVSKDRRLLKSLPLFRDSDFEDFEYELMAALIEPRRYRGGDVIYHEEEMIEDPALMIVRSGILEHFSEVSDKERVLREGDFFGESSLLPDKHGKYCGAKGGTKYREETVEVISDDALCGELTLSNIDSVVLDLHRLGCNRARNRSLPSSVGIAASIVVKKENRPETLEDLEYHQLFGAGTFGRVWIVSRRGHEKTAYALKIQSKRALLDHRQASSALRERMVMAKLDHPFVCKLINTFQDESCIYMLLSFIQGGELLNLIQGGEAHGGLPEIATKFYSAGIVEGLTYMHRRHIVYRDLKPENVLLDSHGYTVIVDFGFAKIVTDKTYTFCGTPLYLAPEIVLSRGHDRAVDYWSLGCLIFEMLYCTTPFYESGIDQKRLFSNIVRAKWKLPDDGKKLSKHSVDLLNGMLEKRPTGRLGG
jgi:protein kinase A